MTTAIASNVSMMEERQSTAQRSTGPMSAGPLFVVGMWRSGTSLLYALLNQHPEIGLMCCHRYFCFRGKARGG
ncbi:MAG: hypothetical protein DMG79_17915 [Acidobacteria bacterium]|nr:MAG: hypothetical protein DMG79_17915 [Acidobacteriota bacterium]